VPGRWVIAVDVPPAPPGTSTPTPGPVAATGLVRVTVTSASRRVDLALPAMVPVAELVPELARSVGALDAGTAPGGHRVVTAAGRSLEPESGLRMQGVVDGSVLALVAGVVDPPGRVHDDLAEAIRDTAERDLAPWRPEAARRAAVAAGALLVVLGGLALAQLGDADLVGATGAVLAVLLLGAAASLSRLSGRPGSAATAVTLAWLAVGYAVVAGRAFGETAAAAGAGPGTEQLVTGAGAAAAGLVALLSLDAGRVLLAPALVAGTAYALAGTVVAGGPGSAGTDLAVRSGTALAVLLVVAVLAGTVLPWVALASTRSRAELPEPAAAGPDGVGPVPPVDADQVTADVRLAHELLVAVAVALGLLLVVAGPATTRLGAGGALLALDACVVVLLRSRHSRSRTEVLTGLGAGLAGLVAVVVTAVLVDASWRPVVAVAGPVLGAVVLGLVATPGRMPRSTEAVLRRRRLGDVAETASLLLLLPLLAWAAGLLGAVGTAAGRL